MHHHQQQQLKKKKPHSVNLNDRQNPPNYCELERVLLYSTWKNSTKKDATTHLNTTN